MNSVVTQRFIKCHNKLKEENRVRSSRQFALSLDYLPQSLSEIMKGRRDVTIELLRKAIAKYKINPVYVYTGEGPMFMEQRNDDDLRVLTVVTDQNNSEKIVHVPFPAQAGYAQSLNDPSFFGELPTFSLPDFHFQSGTFRSFDVTGDSMEPTLYEGDKIVCSFLEPSYWVTGIKTDHVYVVVTKANVLLKRVVNELRTGKRLIMQSDNDFYEPYAIPAEEIKEVWLVKLRISPFLSSPKNIRSHWRDEMTSMKETIHHQNEMINKLNETILKLVK